MDADERGFDPAGTQLLSGRFTGALDALGCEVEPLAAEVEALR